eukprot:scaffold16337_cov76-Cylindrotheca_fusiformis.AAC.3
MDRRDNDTLGFRFDFRLLYFQTYKFAGNGSNPYPCWSRSISGKDRWAIRPRTTRPILPKAVELDIPNKKPQLDVIAMDGQTSIG